MEERDYKKSEKEREGGGNEEVIEGAYPLSSDSDVFLNSCKVCETLLIHEVEGNGFK